MHEGALALDDALAHTLIAQSFPQHADAALRRVGAVGTVNSLLRVGDDLVARFPFHAMTRIDLDSEAAALTEFAAVCPFPSPHPSGIGEGNPAYPSARSLQT
jgi:aminoglycoside phosphotransferase (APT) family kinase protein